MQKKLLAGLLLAALVAAFSPAMAQKSRELYEIKFKDPKKDGYFEPLQEKYFWFKAKKGFHLFDAYTGEAKWSHKELPGFDGKYTLLWDEDYLLYSTKKGVARLDVESGKVAWSTEMEKLKFKDVARWWETDHGLVVQIKNNLALLDIDSGAEKWFLPIKPSGEIVNKRLLPFFYDLGDRFLVLAKDGPVLLDAKTGEILLSIKGKYNKKAEPFVEAGKQVAFFFKDRISFVDLNAAKENFSIEGKIEETTSFELVESGGKNYVLFGFNKRLVAVDGDSGQKLWETAEESFEGSVRWVGPSADPGKVLIATLHADRFGGDAGTYIKLYGIDMASGTVTWEQVIGRSALASGFVNKAFADRDNPRGGYDISVWFQDTYEEGDNRIFLIRGTWAIDPLTAERNETESQGFISVNTRTGKVNYLTRFEILHPRGKEGYSKVGVGVLRDMYGAYPAPIDDGETIIVAGHKSIAKFDKKSGKLLWHAQTPGLPTTMSVQGDVLLAKLGKLNTTTTLEKGGVKTKAQGFKPYGFAAIDINSGKQIWANTEFKIDPIEAMAAVVEDGVLYGCDGEDLYAMSLKDGNFKWKFNIKKDGKAGKITGDKAWAVNVEKSSYSILGSKTITT
ncbi:MAG TPA: hypothetical protein EYG11_20265, partial [Candidatus Latescibacteria bacterium]|nr:hypothetical protein [Candidatus Latescibacterota bacterium]